MIWTWYDMIWYGYALVMISQDNIWYDIDMIWYDMIWYDRL